MSLVTDAANDWQEIINSDLGASWPITITSPGGSSQSLQCRFSDISQQVNPSTNEVASGRTIAVSVTRADLETAGFSDIKGIEKNTAKPWTATLEDVAEYAGTYKIAETNPDRTIGNVVLWLEATKNG